MNSLSRMSPRRGPHGACKTTCLHVHHALFLSRFFSISLIEGRTFTFKCSGLIEPDPLPRVGLNSFSSSRVRSSCPLRRAAEHVHDVSALDVVDGWLVLHDAL